MNREPIRDASQPIPSGVLYRCLNSAQLQQNTVYLAPDVDVVQGEFGCVEAADSMAIYTDDPAVRGTWSQEFRQQRDANGGTIKGETIEGALRGVLGDPGAELLSVVSGTRGYHRPFLKVGYRPSQPAAIPELQVSEQAPVPVSSPEPDMPHGFGRLISRFF